MATALARLAASSQAMFALTGTETDNGASHAIQTVVSIDLSSGAPKIEVLEYRDSALVSRIVGDGERLWKYDIAKNTYKSSNYGTAEYSGKERERLFGLLALRATDHQTFLAHLLNDTFGSGAQSVASSWKPWRPNSQVALAGTNIVCASDQPFSNTLTYIIVDVEDVGLTLMGADYFSESVISGRSRTMHWQVAVFAAQLAQGAVFTFVPPQGSKAVASGGPGG